MDSSVLLSVVGGILLLSIILVSSFCIHCWRNKQPTSIHQRSSDSSPEYNPTFVVRHPQSTYAPHPDHHRIIPSQLPNSLSSPSITAVKIPSCPPSESGSQASYVNQNDSEDKQYPQPPDEPDNYIIVIPDSPNTQPQRPSRASSHSSGENYINIDVIESDCDKDSDSDSELCVDYENVTKNPDLGNQTPALSFGSINSDDRGSSDYVNTYPHLL